jgi:hypothetical protein
VVADAPVGPTPLARAARAQSSARERGAVVAIWADAIDASGAAVPMVRVVPVDGEVRQAPLAPSQLAEPRAFAVVAASLLHEVLGGGPEVAGVVVVSVPGGFPADVAGSTDVAVTRGAFVPEATGAAIDPLAEEQDEPWVGAYGGLALGAVALTNDVAINAGPVFRGAIGARIGETLRLGAQADVAGLIGTQAEAWRVMIRLGVSVGVELPIDACRLVLAGHARAMGTNLGPGGSGEWAPGISAGGSIELSIPIDGALGLDVGVEVDGIAADVSSITPWVAPSVWVGVSWS